MQSTSDPRLQVIGKGTSVTLRPHIPQHCGMPRDHAARAYFRDVTRTGQCPEPGRPVSQRQLDCLLELSQEKE